MHPPAGRTFKNLQFNIICNRRNKPCPELRQSLLWRLSAPSPVQPPDRPTTTGQRHSEPTRPKELLRDTCRSPSAGNRLSSLRSRFRLQPAAWLSPATASPPPRRRRR